MQAPAGARAAAPIRPVVRADRRVELAPRRGAEGAPPPDPIHAGGRVLASPQAPLIPHPSAREPVASPKLAPGAVVTPREPAPREREAPREIAPRNAPPPQPAPRNAPPPSAPPPAIAASPHPLPERAPEGREFSRPPRRMAEPGPDPLAQAPQRGPERPPETHGVPQTKQPPKEKDREKEK